MVVLDTDHLSVLEWSGSRQELRLRTPLEAVRSDEVFTTIVNYEEQMRGWRAFIAKERGINHQIEGFR